MLTPRRSYRSAATRAHCVAVAFPAITVALAGRNTVTMTTAVTDGIAHSVPANIPAGGRRPTSATAAASTPTATAASTMPECRSCGEGGHY